MLNELTLNEEKVVEGGWLASSPMKVNGCLFFVILSNCHQIKLRGKKRTFVSIEKIKWKMI